MGGDILDEGFENPGYENTWAETVTGGAIDDSNQDVARPTGGEDYIAKLTKTSGTYDSQAVWDNESEIAVTYTTFYVQINAEGLGNGNSLQLARAITAGNAICWDLFLYQDGSGNLQFRIRVWEDAGPPDFTDYSSNLSLDQWYRVDVKYDVTGSAWEWRVDEGSEGSDTLSSSRNPQKWTFGGLEDYTLTAYFDSYNIDSSGYVSFVAVTFIPKVIMIQ